MIQKGVMPRHVADYLINKINTTGIVICGKGASGKTTLLNVLLDCIDYGRSGLVIQESEEIFSNKHPDFMFQHITSSKNGRPAYGLKEEATNGLLTDLVTFVMSFTGIISTDFSPTLLAHFLRSSSWSTGTTKT